MKKQFYSAMLVTSLAAFTIGMAGCGCSNSGTPSGDVAIVDDQHISADQFYKWLQRKNAANVVVDPNKIAGLLAYQQKNHSFPAQTVAPLGFEALQDLINQQLMLEVAKEKGVMPTQDDINAELKFDKEQKPTVVSDSEAQGMNLQEIRDDIRLALIQFRLTTAGVTVTQKEATNYISSHPEQFTEPAKFVLRVIEVKTEKDEKAVNAALSSGQTFAAVANSYSDAPNAREGGAWSPNGDPDGIPVDYIKRAGSMGPKLAATLEQMDELKTTPWYPNNGKFVIFYLQKRNPAKKIDKPDLVEVIRRNLAQQKGAGIPANNLDHLIRQKMAVAKIQVIKPEYKLMWQAFAQDQKNQEDAFHLANPTVK